MSEENTNQSEIIDFGFDVNAADVARPVLKAGSFNATISFVRSETKDNGNMFLNIGYALTEPAVTIEDKPVNPNFTLTQRILTTPTGKLTQEMINDRVKRIHFAAAGAGRVNTGAWVGKPVRIRVSLREPHVDDKTGIEYGASNDIAAVLPPPKQQAA